MLTQEQFQNILTTGPVLLDGATGSNLQAVGMPLVSDELVVPAKKAESCAV